MTNPTLERAARADVETPLEKAAYAAALADGVKPECDSWVEYFDIARAVLMAVLPDEVDADGAPDWMDPAQAYGWGCGFNACRHAILNDGEGE